MSADVVGNQKDEIERFVHTQLNRRQALIDFLFEYRKSGMSLLVILANGARITATPQQRQMVSITV